MQLKEIVDTQLKERNRSLSWLASEMDKSFDGLKLSLIKESIKYSDLKRMAEILEIQPQRFFDTEVGSDEGFSSQILEDVKIPYKNLRSELSSCKELVSTLKSQIKDKEQIIQLLSGK